MFHLSWIKKVRIAVLLVGGDMERKTKLLPISLSEGMINGFHIGQLDLSGELLVHSETL